MRRFPVAAATLWLSLSCSGGAGPPPTPPSPLADIVRAHWDQACLDGRPAPAAILASEVFDTVGLGDEVGESAALRPYLRDREASLDFVSRYDANGRPRGLGVWDFTIDSAAAIEAAGVLRRRVCPVGRLLQSEGFRTRLTFFPAPLPPGPRTPRSMPQERVPLEAEQDEPVGVQGAHATAEGGAAGC